MGPLKFSTSTLISSSVDDIGLHANGFNFTSTDIVSSLTIGGEISRRVSQIEKKSVLECSFPGYPFCEFPRGDDGFADGDEIDCREKSEPLMMSTPKENQKEKELASGWDTLVGSLQVPQPLLRRGCHRSRWTKICTRSLPSSSLLNLRRYGSS